MNFINLIGIQLFLYLYYKFKSFIALSIYLNGLLYHIFKLNVFLINDYLFNIIYILYGIYNSNNLNNYYLIFSLLFILFFKKFILNIKKNSLLDQILHVLFIQYTAFYMLYKYFKIQKSKNRKIQKSKNRKIQKSKNRKIQKSKNRKIQKSKNKVKSKS